MQKNGRRTRLLFASQGSQSGVKSMTLALPAYSTHDDGNRKYSKYSNFEFRRLLQTKQNYEMRLFNHWFVWSFTLFRPVGLQAWHTTRMIRVELNNAANSSSNGMSPKKNSALRIWSRAPPDSMFCLTNLFRMLIWSDYEVNAHRIVRCASSNGRWTIFGWALFIEQQKRRILCKYFPTANSNWNSPQK